MLVLAGAQLALITSIPDAAAMFPTWRETAIRAELAARGILLEVLRRPRRAPAGRTPRGASSRCCSRSSCSRWTMTGRTGWRGADPTSGALPSGIGMILRFGILAVLEPGRTRGTLYRGGSVGGGTFVFFAVLWLAAAAIVVAGGVAGEPAAVLGLVVQLVAVAGAIVLAVVALRHDRARPQVLADQRRRPRSTCRASSSNRPSSGRVSSAAWRTGVATPTPCSPSRKRARVRAAEAEVARLVADRTAAQGGAPAA